MYLSNMKPTSNTSNRINLRNHLVAGSLAVLIGLPGAFPAMVNAQTESGDKQAEQQGQQQMQPSQQRQQQMQASQGQAKIQEGFLPLVGREVRNMNYETIGEIENVVADLEGNMTKVVVSVGGFWDIGDTDVLVPVEKLQMTEKRRYIFYNGTEEELESFPEYRGFYQGIDPRVYRNRTIVSSRYGDGELREAYSRQDYDSKIPAERRDLYTRAPGSYYGPNPRALGQQRYHEEEQRRQRQYSENWSNTDKDLVMASDLVGRTVRNPSGEEIGDIDDVIISRQGRVSVVLDVGEYVDQDDKQVLADLRDLSVDANRISYDVSRQELKNDPAYRPDSGITQG